MSKIRVYQLAKELEISSKELIEKLKELSIEVNSHMSTLEDENANILIELFTEESKPKTISNTKEKPPNQEQHDENKLETLDNKEDIIVNTRNKKEKRNKNKNKRNKNSMADNYDDRVESKGERVIQLKSKVTVKELAEIMDKNVSEIITKLIGLGIMATINQELDYDTAQIIASEFGVEVEPLEDVTMDDVIDDIEIEPDRPEDLKPRSPVVTVMGHVDHGKTSLLDAIRKTKVTSREAGGITQHIGASEVKVNDKKIVLLDTPGHEAFTSMRARGAKVTDIAILVVAADDGVMPQTIEAINHAKAAEVPIIIAINKMDKPSANPDRVKQELADHGILIEEWGGDVISVPVSALNGENIDTLLEMILLVAEMEEFKANPNRKAIGTVIEAQLDVGKGSVATILIQNGTLKIGDSVVIGTTHGRIRAMMNDKGKRVNVAGPSTAVEITGLSEVPEAGDQLFAVEDDKIARAIVEKRINKIKAEQLKASQKISLDALFSQMEQGQIKDLNLIVKADVQGSVEAVKQSLIKLSNDEVVINPIHGGVGAITETDVNLAAASNAIIIGFNVRPTASADSLAKKENVDIRSYRVIYKAIEDIEAAMKGMLDPEFKEEDLGKAEVRATFKVPGAGTIGGCYVIEGKILRNAKVRLVRDGIIIHEGTIDSLKRFKDDAREVATGYECGIGLSQFNDLKEGDIIEAYQMKEIER
ncbi:translation initiation factor IF-2 [Alkaliphilus sp. MSJ-5]|uniref:Translation initiation factor IF-2 n=1 Tax=Alkaliphilus flagellatus TaxID=2841507 RepID=A0ABS6G7T5_9FIRM|nr:translation initiation factor IF-2 [Alkaliphilus flagellatus]MBU5677461.1 translation initiation factor IF-2 [Alkaliphilus flagellatus]